MSYDPTNIFGKILRGELPAHKVYEDDTALVMMDIFPQSRGHLLVIPKAESRNLLDADPPYVTYLVGTYTAGFDAENANPLGRFVALQVTKQW